ncbi:hypothetical protein [Pyxidicoccus fallax]|nr:hypothetical protein [Pyxidicoccus fallax]
MSKKDVLHIPPEAYPTPDRDAGPENDDGAPHEVTPIINPDGGPGHTPGGGTGTRIIEPVTTGTERYPGVSVT